MNTQAISSYGNDSLGRWAVIDIETTGIDPSQDSIIDIGFLQFEGTKLVRTYSSLVRCEVPISKFIQKLTGISQQALKRAPAWSKVEVEFQDLKGHHLIAHNAKFELSFLGKSLEAVDSIEGERDIFHDSMLFLALLFPEKSSLNLESFLVELGIKDKEDHRGLEDSIDLLKTLLFVSYLVKQDSELEAFYGQLLSSFSAEEFWFGRFLQLSVEQLLEISSQIEFDLFEVFERYAAKKSEQELEDWQDQGEVDFEFSGKNIQKIFRDEERLRQIFPDYKLRKAQEDMALRVGQAFNNRIHALIQAPTGTGKTLGYLLPAALLSQSKQEPVLIATGTKALQNQAVQKDIPLLKRFMAISSEQLNVIRLVGSKNHFCELKFRNLDEQDLLNFTQDFDQKFSNAYIDSVLFYNQRTKDYNYTLTNENTPYVLKKTLTTMQDLLNSIAVDYRSCIGNKCPFSYSCTYLQGLRRAKEARLIIGNHSLMLNWPRGIERPKYIVVDEAHKMENEVSNAFTSELAQHDVEKLAKNLPQTLGPLFYLLSNVEKQSNEKLIEHLREHAKDSAQMLEDNLPSLAESIEQYAKALPRYTDIYWNEVPMLRPQALKNTLETSIFNHLESVRFIFKSLYEKLLPFASRWEISSFGDNQNHLTAWSAFESAFTQIEQACETLDLLMKDDGEYVSAIRFHGDWGYLLQSSPVNTGKLVYDQVLSESDCTVFTSATLSNQNGSIGMASVEWMTGYQYLDPQRRFKTGLFLSNDFDYQKNAKIFLASDTTSIYQQEYVDQVLSSLIPVIKQIGGKTLLLYSSRARFERATEILLEKLESEVTLFIQGMGQNVVEDFKNAKNSVLIGMESFGEGIDVPGDALKLVYVDKIPDLRRDLVVDARRDFYSRNFGNEFVDYFLAGRCRSLHQKLGRLMRRETDSGAVIITDPRVKSWKGRTLSTFRELMQPYEIDFCELDLACEKAMSFVLETSESESSKSEDL